MDILLPPRPFHEAAAYGTVVLLIGQQHDLQFLEVGFFAS
jgi:hypothetical protein